MAITPNTQIGKEAAELIELARKAQEQRRAVQDMKTDTRYELPMRSLVERFAPECIATKDKPASFHAYFGKDEDALKDAGRGYMPVLDPRGDQVKHEGLRLWKLPMDIHKHDQKVVTERSKRMLADAQDTSKDSDTHRNPVVVDEKTTILKASDPAAKRLEAEAVGATR